jgi:hypothetical protein
MDIHKNWSYAEVSLKLTLDDRVGWAETTLTVRPSWPGYWKICRAKSEP